MRSQHRLPREALLVGLGNRTGLAMKNVTATLLGTAVRPLASAGHGNRTGREHYYELLLNIARWRLWMCSLRRGTVAVRSYSRCTGCTVQHAAHAVRRNAYRLDTQPNIQCAAEVSGSAYSSNCTNVSNDLLVVDIWLKGNSIGRALDADSLMARQRARGACWSDIVLRH